MVERLYSRGLYAALQPLATSISNLTPLALLDGVILLVFGAWLMLAGRDVLRAGRSRWVRGAARIVWRTVVWSAVIYLLFLVAWGFNYRRVRLTDKLEFRSDTVTPDAVLAIANRAVNEVNQLHREAHAGGFGDFGAIDRGLAGLVQRTTREVAGAHALVVGRPKRSLLDWYFRRAAVSGMTDPFFLETLVASDVLPFERPMVVAHEWSHLAGIADEGEANFLGWLACARGSVPARYSAWLFLYQEVLPSLPRAQRAAVVARLDPGPRADLRAIRERFERNVSPRVSAVGWRVYDSYLKANRVEAGAASYAEVVRLVAGTRFDPDWTPLLRATP